MTKKILKYKSLIAFCLVFLLAFGVVTDYKQKETQAFVLVDDLLFWVLGGLVLATGVVALSPLQQKDMGFNVFNKFKSFGYNEEDLFVDVLHGTGKAIKFGTGLKSAIDFVSKNLSNTKIKSDMPISVTADKVPQIFTTIDNSNKDKRYIYNISGIKDNSFKFVFAFPGAYESFTNVVSIPNGVNYVQLQFGYANPSNTFLSWQMIFDGVERGWNSISAGGNTLVLKNYTGSITGQFQIEVDYTSPKIKANYSETALNTSIPYDDSKPAYVPIPSREVIDTKTYDKPVTYDDVKDIVETIPLDTPVDTPVDTPSGILEGIKSFFSGLWDMLKGLLNGILGAIGALGDLIKSLIGGLLSGLSSLLSSILDVIKSILSSIGNIVSGILNGLLDLIKSLFLPTVAVSELFSPPVGSGFSLLLDLFNWDNLWSIDPKPYRFKQNWDYVDITGGDNNFSEPVEIKPFEVSIIQDNLSIIRNILSYSILIAVIWFIIYHFLPERSMD